VASAFGGQRSIQLSYGRIFGLADHPLLAEFGHPGNPFSGSPGRGARPRSTAPRAEKRARAAKGSDERESERFILTKSEICPICFCCRNLFLLGPGEDSLWLFEMFATTTAACEPGRRRIPYFLARNPLKSPDSEK
jgi:hypothetical protein